MPLQVAIECIFQPRAFPPQAALNFLSSASVFVAEFHFGWHGLLVAFELLLQILDSITKEMFSTGAYLYISLVLVNIFKKFGHLLNNASVSWHFSDIFDSEMYIHSPTSHHPPTHSSLSLFANGKVYELRHLGVSLDCCLFVQFAVILPFVL